jgi:sodium-dependent phosphate cotransporter
VLTIGFVHTRFNVSGILILYAIPILRPLPILGAERLAEVAVRHRMLAVAYVGGAFIVVPLVGLALFR